MGFNSAFKGLTKS